MSGAVRHLRAELHIDGKTCKAAATTVAHATTDRRALLSRQSGRRTAYTWRFV
jgi:hypothetical protein